MSSTLQGALKNGLGDAVVACDMPETCKSPSLDSCQTRFLWTHEGVDLAPRPVIGLVVQVGDATKFPQASDRGPSMAATLRLFARNICDVLFS